MSVGYSALLTYSAALNRPAYQSSVYVDWSGRSWNASLANDGNHETNAFKDNKRWCSASQRETNPWWAVDLGRPTEVIVQVCMQVYFVWSFARSIAIMPVTRALHSIFLSVWRTGRIPCHWKDGIIVTLFKGKGHKTDCSNYRPITLLYNLHPRQSVRPCPFGAYPTAAG